MIYNINIKKQEKSPLSFLFEKYKGDDEVYLHLLGSKKIVKTDKSFWVDSSKAGFKEEIIKVLGPDCFI